MSEVEKIRKVLEIKGISLFQATRELGLGQGTLHKMMDRGRGWHPSTKEKFLRHFNINPEWWMSGEGDIFIAKSTPVPEYRKQIPFYDTVAMGGLSVAAEQDPVYRNSAEYIEPGTWFNRANGALRVYGHSMFPKYPAGCIVAFRECRTDTVLIWGEDYVLELEDRRILKRVEKSEQGEGYLKAVSYNKSTEYSYAPVEIARTAIKRIFMVLGKVEMEASV